MGYFSNGTEGELYQRQWCDRCIHRDDYEAGTFCEVWSAHIFYQKAVSAQRSHEQAVSAQRSHELAVSAQRSHELAVSAQRSHDGETDRKTDLERVLDLLIPRTGTTNEQCTMFVEVAS